VATPDVTATVPWNAVLVGLPASRNSQMTSIGKLAVAEDPAAIEPRLSWAQDPFASMTWATVSLLLKRTFPEGRTQTALGETPAELMLKVAVVPGVHVPPVVPPAAVLPPHAVSPRVARQDAAMIAGLMSSLSDGGIGSPARGS
jgi:hypothetical protein